jgi:TIR domain
MPQVLVSYTSTDRDVAVAIVRAMVAAGLEVYDPSSVSPELSSVDKFRCELESARCLVLFWSIAASKSELLQQEIHQAVKAWSLNRLLLVKLDRTPLPIGLRDLPFIFAPDSFHSGTREVISRAYFITGIPNIEELPHSANGSDILLSPIHPETYSKDVGTIKKANNKPRRLSIYSTIIAIASVIGVLLWLLAMIWFNIPGTQYVYVPVPEAQYGYLAQSEFVPNVRYFWTIGPFVIINLAVLLLGILVGAGVLWVWSARSRRASIRTPYTAMGGPVFVSSNAASKVFVSYSREDEGTVEALVKQIEQFGYPVWIDRESTGLQRYAAAIGEAIRTSKLVALMCSRNALASDHVVREIYLAGDYKKPFIVFQLDPTELPDEVRYFVSGFPRVPIAKMDPRTLQSEIQRLMVA